MSLKATALFRAVAMDLGSRTAVGKDVLRRLNLCGGYSSPFQQEMDTLKLDLGANPEEVASLALCQSLFKKFQTSENTTDQQNSAAISKFRDVNRRVGNWEFAPNTSGDEELMGSVKEHLWHFWNPSGFPLISNPLSVLDKGNTGPGSSIGANGEDFYTKVASSPFSCTTEGLYAFYKHWCNERELTRDAEILRHTKFPTLRITSHNRLSFVPKDDLVSRTIATEPSLNMIFQLGTGEILRQRIFSFFGIDLLHQQQWNREAARIGSLETDAFRTGFATIDLSSASDSLGLKLLEYLLPKESFRWLEKLRCPSGLLPDGSEVVYNMMSTMGNGYTFPLQTMLFAAVVVVAIKSMGYTPIRPNSSFERGKSEAGYPVHVRLGPQVGHFGVFGDDIVCHPLVAPRVLRLLELFGFQVNRNKTFVEGPFRESCGRDFYKGHDVRGVYIKRPLLTAPTLHVAINSLNAWSYRTGIELPETGRLLCLWLKEIAGIMPVPLDESLAAGIRMPLSVLRLTGLTYKQNKNLSFVYSRWLAAPKQLRIEDGFITVPKGTKRRIYNPPGLLLAFLRGDVRSGRISIRQSDIRFRVKRCVTPNWDYVPPVSDLIRQAGDRFRMRRFENSSEVMFASLIRG